VDGEVERDAERVILDLGEKLAELGPSQTVIDDRRRTRGASAMAATLR
jgi:hypothetical protein